MAITSVVFDLSALSSVDSSALIIFLDIVTAYRSRNARVCLVKLRKGLRDSFQRAGIIDVVGKDSCFRKLEKAVEDIQKQNLSNLATIEPQQQAAAAGEEVLTPEQHAAVGAAMMGSPSSPSSSGLSDSSRSLSVAGSEVGSVVPAIVLGATSPGGVEMSGPVGQLHSTPVLRRKKSSFFAPPVVGSPLLRGITKMKM